MKNLVLLLLCISLLMGCASKTIVTESDIKIALLTDSYEGENKFISQASDQLYLLEEEYNFISSIYHIDDLNAWEEVALELAKNEYDLIIGLGWQATTPFASMASTYDQTKFAVIDVIGIGHDVKGVNFDMFYNNYVLGVMIATAFPDETKMGYIGNYNDEANYQYLNGFTKGIHSINPDIQIVREYADTYSEQDIVYEKAMELASQDITFIMGSVSSLANEGLYQAALDLAEEGTPIYTTGLSIDQTREENPYILGGTRKDTGIALDFIITSFFDGSFTTDDKTTTILEGGSGTIFINVNEPIPVNYQNHEFITIEVIKAGYEALDEIRYGNISIE
ncbi:MAG: BMP family ABC transporter substrate-binding protein [Eubacteriales bacterium]